MDKSATRSPDPRSCDGLTSHLRLLGLWEHERAATPADLEPTDIIHRQAVWLELMLGRLQTRRT